MKIRQQKELCQLSESRGHILHRPRVADKKKQARAFLIEMMLLQTWLREKHFLHPYIVPYGDCESWTLVNIGYTNRKDEYRLVYEMRRKYENVKFKSYEDALLVALKEALLIIPAR